MIQSKLKERPDTFLFNLLNGQLMLMQQKFGEADVCFDKALSIDKNSLEAMQGKAMVLLNQQKFGFS